MKLSEVKYEEEIIVQNPNSQFDNLKIRIGLTGIMAEGEKLQEQIVHLQNAVKALALQRKAEKLAEWNGTAKVVQSFVQPGTPTPSLAAPAFVAPPAIPDDLPPFDL